MLKIVIFLVCAIALTSAASDTVEDEQCPAVNGEFVTFLAHESDRQSFYVCDNGVKVAMKCPGNLLWNDAVSSCDFSFNIDEEDSGESSAISSESSSSESKEYNESNLENFVMEFAKIDAKMAQEASLEVSDDY